MRSLLALYQDICSFTKSKTIFSRDYYEKMKDYFHPNIPSFIDDYSGSDDDLIMLPPYHGCGSGNRNRTKKLIDYKNGNQCLCPVWSNRKEIDDSCNRPFTRNIAFSSKDRALFKNKGSTIFNYTTNQYDHLLDTPDRDNFKRFPQIEDIYLESEHKCMWETGKKPKFEM